jgi:hypothetical protein
MVQLKCNHSYLISTNGKFICKKCNHETIHHINGIFNENKTNIITTSPRINRWRYTTGGIFDV